MSITENRESAIFDNVLINGMVKKTPLKINNMKKIIWLLAISAVGVGLCSHVLHVYVKTDKFVFDNPRLRYKNCELFNATIHYIEIEKVVSDARSQMQLYPDQIVVSMHQTELLRTLTESKPKLEAEHSKLRKLVESISADDLQQMSKLEVQTYNIARDIVAVK